MEVRAVGLNFRDVLNVLGAYPGDPGPPGGDSAGFVTAVWSGSSLEVGDAMFGYGTAPLASACFTTEPLIAHKPSCITFEQASTLPTVWNTVHDSLKCGDTHSRHNVLLHAAAGGVGLVGVEYTYWLRTRVLGTAGRPSKHRHLRDAEVRRMASSRDFGPFAYGAAEQMRRQRVHVSLNSLSNDFISASFALLAEGAHWAEIGKVSTWSHERHKTAAGFFDYHMIAIDVEMALEPGWMRRGLSVLGKRIILGGAHALPLRSFEMVGAWEMAFRTLQAGQNTGKIVLRTNAVRSWLGERDGTHALSGGTGGLGLLTARWLAQSGASSIVLVSRSGKFVAGTANEHKQLEATGVKWRVERCDFAEGADVRRVLLAPECGPADLRGFWHAAGVLSDAMLAKQDIKLLTKVYGPKAHASRHVHSMCHGRELQACMLFSSIAALQGNSGQVNYSAANHQLDMLAVLRRAAGQAAVSTQWGAWAEIGMAANALVEANMKAAGMGLIGLAMGLEVLRKAVSPLSATVSAVLVLTWSKVLANGVPAWP